MGNNGIAIRRLKAKYSEVARVRAGIKAGLFWIFFGACSELFGPSPNNSEQRANKVKSKPSVIPDIVRTKHMASIVNQ